MNEDALEQSAISKYALSEPLTYETDKCYSSFVIILCVDLKHNKLNLNNLNIKYNKSPLLN